MFKKNKRHNIPLEKYQRKIFGKLENHKPICIVSDYYMDKDYNLKRIERLSEKYNVLLKVSINLKDPNYFSKLKYQIEVLKENNLLFFKGVITEFDNIIGPYEEDVYKSEYDRNIDFGYYEFLEGDKANE